MKYLLMITLFFMACNEQTSKSQLKVLKSNSGHWRIMGDTLVTYGMDYMILHSNDGGVYAINLTKDSLECALAKQQLELLK